VHAQVAFLQYTKYRMRGTHRTCGDNMEFNTWESNFQKHLAVSSTVSLTT